MTTAPPTTPCPAGCEDLSIFDETDPNSDITIGTYRASADTMRRDVDAYVTDDYGAGYFEYFDIEFEMEITASDTDGQMVLCAVSNVAASKQDMQSSQSAWIAVYNNAGNLRCEIVEFPSVNNAYFDFSGSTVGKRYFRFRRYRGAFSMYVYSDADRTVLVASKTISGSATNTYRYLNVLASREAAGTATITGYTQCFKLLEAPTTPCPLDSEDLTTYTEVDPGADLNVTASAVEFFALPANLNSYVYYDFGAGNIEDYVINFEAELTYANPSGAQVAICGISNTLGGCNDWNVADDGLQVSLSYNGSQITTMMKCQDNEVSDTMVESGMAIPLRYYTLTKSGTAFTLDIYVDEDRTILLDQLSITGVDSAKRYLFAFANLHAGGSQVCTGYTRCFQAYINPTTPPGTTAAATTEAPTTVAPTTVAPTTVAPTTVAPTTVAPTTLAPTTLAATTLAPTTLCPVECEDLSAFTEVDSGSDITVTADRVTVDSMAQSADSYVYDDYGVDYFGNFEINFEFEVTDSQSNSQMVVICLSNTIGRKSDFISANDGMLVEVYNSSGNITVNIKDYNTDDAGTPYVLGSGNTCDRVWCTLIRDGSDLELNIYSDAARTVLVQSLTLTCETGLKRYLYALTSQNAGSSAYISGYTQCFNIISANFTTAGPTTVAPTTIAATTLAPTTLAATTLAPTTLAPTTLAVTTLAPTTSAPTTTLTTSPPTTVGPTTEPPCIWNDDMTGTDGSLPDSGYWEVVDGTPQVQSNRFRFVKIGIGTSDKARSTFFLGSGDFEFQIEWDITIPAIGGGTRIRLYDYSYTEWAYAQRIRNASGQQVQAQTNNIPVSTLLSILDASYFGFRRTGNTLVIYGNRGFGDPETFLTDNSFYTGAMLIEIDNWNYAAVPDLTSYWDNFEVITGCDNIDYFVSTAAPTTIAPTTPVPTTVGPTTIAPTTIAPTTLAPTTAAPTTVAGTTVAPVTTAVPTTVAGTTVAPTTLTVTTLVPTTEAPFACVHSEYSLIVSEDTLDSDITDEVTLNSIITSEATLNSVIC